LKAAQVLQFLIDIRICYKNKAIPLLAGGGNGGGGGVPAGVVDVS